MALVDECQLKNLRPGGNKKRIAPYLGHLSFTDRDTAESYYRRWLEYGAANPPNRPLEVQLVRLNQSFCRVKDVAPFAVIYPVDIDDAAIRDWSNKCCGYASSIARPRTAGDDKYATVLKAVEEVFHWAIVIPTRLAPESDQFQSIVADGENEFLTSPTSLQNRLSDRFRQLVAAAKRRQIDCTEEIERYEVDPGNSVGCLATKLGIDATVSNPDHPLQDVECHIQQKEDKQRQVEEGIRQPSVRSERKTQGKETIDNATARLKFRTAGDLYKHGSVAEALSILQELRDALPESKEVLYASALCLIALGRDSEALPLAEKLKTVYADPRGDQLRERLLLQGIPPRSGDPGDTKGPRYTGSKICAQCGRKAHVLAHVCPACGEKGTLVASIPLDELQGILNKQSEARSLVDQSMAFMQQELFAEAENVLKRAQEINPYNACAFGNMGGVYFLQERFAEAIPWLEKALSLDPTLEGIPGHLAIAKRKVVEPKPLS